MLIMLCLVDIFLSGTQPMLKWLDSLFLQTLYTLPTQMLTLVNLTFKTLEIIDACWSNSKCRFYQTLFATDAKCLAKYFPFNFHLILIT